MLSVMDSQNQKTNMSVIDSVRSVYSGKHVVFTDVKDTKNKPKRIIFSTKGGEYKDDSYDPDTHILFYNGQASGKRDHMIDVGAEVWYRTSTKDLYFCNIGTVAQKTLMRRRVPRDGNQKAVPALYRLLINEHPVQVTIQRAPNVKYTHESVLRYNGSTEIIRSFPQGLYEIQVF